MTPIRGIRDLDRFSFAPSSLQAHPTAGKAASELLSKVLAMNHADREHARECLNAPWFEFEDNPEVLILWYQKHTNIPGLTFEQAWTAVNYNPDFIVLIPHRLLNVHMLIAAVLAYPELMDAAMDLVTFGQERPLQDAYRARTGCRYHTALE